MPYKIRKVRNKQCWSVINEKTKKLHSKCTSLNKAKAQVRLLESMHGDGLIDSAKELANKVSKKFIGDISSRPSAINNLIKTKGTHDIVKVDVCRDPVQTVYKKVINLLSKGQFAQTMKDYGYDDIYHLFIVLTLDDGSVYSIEKNQRVTVIKGDKSGAKTERKSVTVKKNLSDFITNGEATGGTFYRYSANKENCQHFVKTLLDANGIRGLDSFVTQDADSLLSPFAKKVVQAVTDVAAVADRTLSGGRKKRRPRRKISC